MKIYISGQISGLKQQEYTDNFALAEALMMLLDHEAVNPLKVGACLDEDCYPGTDRKEDGTYLHAYGCYMKYDILAMLECDAIALLPNWKESAGAQFEAAVAHKCGLKILFIEEDYQELRKPA